MGVAERGRAIVLGAGMAGLFAASVLAGAYAEVVVVDRDTLTDDESPRRRVPQGRHVHGLLARGQQVIEDLLPGWTDDVIRAGAAHGDVTGSVQWILDGGTMRQPQSGLRVISAGRPFLERSVRDRVSALSGVHVYQRHDVDGLLTEESPGGRVVCGVTVIGPDGEPRSLPAALVVDATGRGSRTPSWLAEQGRPVPAEESFKIGLGYTTRHYRIPTGVLDGLSVHIVATPSSPRGAVCSRVGGDRFVVTAYGMNGDHPPSDEEGFATFLTSLPAPDVHDVVQAAEPLDDLVTYRFPTNLRRRYENLAEFPDGLLTLGDAVCSFNPTYAQGMTVAAIEAQVLREHLARPGDLDPLAFYADIARDAIDPAWDIALGNDSARSGLIPSDDPAMRSTSKLLTAATRHDEVAVAYARVVSLLDPPEALGRPEITELADRAEEPPAPTVSTGEVRQVTVGDLRFDVWLAGPADGEPVVLLHGWPHHFGSWTDVAPLLHRAGMRTIAPNQRGYSPGARPDDVEDYALPLLGGDVLGLLDALGVPCAHLAGHDWGAIVAWYLAARHPERVQSLTAVAFPHLDAYRHAYRVDPEQQEASRYINLLTADGAAEWWLADDAARLSGLLATSGALTADQQHRYVEFHTTPGAFAASLKWYQAGRLPDGDAGLGPVTVPTTFLWSEADVSVSTTAAERTADHVQAPYRMVTLRDGESHWQPQEVPGVVAAEILARAAADGGTS